MTHVHDFESKFDELFGLSKEDVIPIRHSPPRSFFGVVKWFNPQKEPNGYIVTTGYGFDGIKKPDYDFIEMPFSSAICAKGYTPTTKSLVVISTRRINGRLCVSSLRNTQYAAEDFKLALKYATRGIFNISGVSKKSANDWACNVHILKELSKGGVLLNEKAIDVKSWISSYLIGLPEPKRKEIIATWMTDVFFATHLQDLLPTSNLSTPSYLKDKTPSESLANVELQVLPISSVRTEQRVEQMPQHSDSNPVPKGYSRAHDKLTNKIYISNVGKRLRQLNNPSDIDYRRWVWELLQNAKDSIAGVEGRTSVRAEFSIHGAEVTFKHDGAPFTYDALDALLYKYSEGKESGESTGRFGTGFLTTHCLSKVVDISGDVFDDEAKNGRRGFSVTMFRDGQDDQELLSGLERMRETLDFSRSPTGITTFTYHVADCSTKAIELGIGELKANLCKVMLFCPQLGMVTLNDNGVHFVVNRRAITKVDENVTLYEFELQDGENSTLRRFLVSSVDEPNESLSKKYKQPRNVRLDAAIEIDAGNGIIGHSEEVPLYCVFPLVGIEEQLSEPLILNSPDWEPDEERQHLLFTGTELIRDTDIATENGINRMIYGYAPVLYQKLVSFVEKENICRTYVLADGLRNIKTNKDLDRDWYKAHVQNEYRRILRVATVIEQAQGGERTSLADSFIVEESSAERTSAVSRLMSAFTSGGEVKCPIMDNDEWAKRLWHEEDLQFWNIKTLCNYVAGKKNWGDLPLLEGTDRVDWFNHFLAVVQEYEEALLGQVPLIPDMLGGLHTAKDKDLEQSDGVDDLVITLMQRLESDVRPRLMHLGIKEISLERKFNSIRYSSEINNLIKVRIADFGRKIPNTWPRVIDAFRPLLEVRPVGDKCSEGFKNKRAATENVLRSCFNDGVASIESGAFHESAWKEMDDWLSKQVPSYIQQDCPGEMKQSEDATISKLNVFYHWFETVCGSFCNWRVFPNQHGSFMALRELAYEAEPIDATLKDMVARLDGKSDFRSKLIDVRCKTTKERPAHAVTQKEVCDVLDQLVDSGKDSLKDDETYRAVVRELLDEWAESHKDKFKLYFPRADRNYNELELNVVHTKEERRLANDLLKEFKIQELEDLRSGKLPERFRMQAGGQEVAMEFADGRMGDLSKEEMKEAQTEAKLKAKELLEAKGFELTKGICNEDFTLINGVKKDGIEYPVVVRSYKDESRQFQLSTTDWEQLVKPNSTLLVLKRDGRIYSVNFRELIAKREKIDLSFSTHNLDIGERIGQLATVLRWFDGLKFDFDKLTASRAGVVESFDLPEQGIPEGQRVHELSPDNPLEVF